MCDQHKENVQHHRAFCIIRFAFLGVFFASLRLCDQEDSWMI
jgi:hypothetical protein